MESSVNISFIVPLKNEESTIGLCLEAIGEQMKEGDEAIVVDNGSTDASLAIVRKFPHIRLIEKADVSIGALRNLGTEMATGDIVAFIDADCVLQNGWRNRVSKVLLDQQIAATGSKYALPAKPHWIERAWFAQKKLNAGEVPYINSGNLAVRKSIFDAIGGFDSNLSTGEDAELCWRLKSRGHIVWEDPQIQAVHLGNPKDLWNFYKKQRWHGLGMFGTFKVSWFDKPVIMTFTFLLCWLILGLMILTAAFTQWKFSILLAVALALFVPALTAVFRCIQFQQFKLFPHYLLLYFFYFSARAEALFRICYKQVLQPDPQKAS